MGVHQIVGRFQFSDRDMVFFCKRIKGFVLFDTMGLRGMRQRRGDQHHYADKADPNTFDHTCPPFVVLKKN
jgi:hypothetical protein